MPNEKSSSSDSSNRFFCVSVITLYESCFVSVGVRSGMSRRCNLPCTRTCGGVLIARCRSEPCKSTVIFKSSGNVGGILSVPHSGNSQLRIDNYLFHRLACYFFYRRQAVLHFTEPAHPERQHAFFNRLAAKLEARRADEHQLAQLVG